MFRRGWMLFLPLTLALLFGCEDNGASPGTQADKPEVQVSSPVSDTLTDYEVFTGRTQAFNTYEIRARVTGYLDQAPFQQGDDVKKGDVLFVIQQKPFRDALNQAKGTRDQQKAQLTYYDALYKRNRNLSTNGSATVEETQQSRASRDGTEAALRSAEAAVEIAQQNLDWTVIRAPFDGRMSRRLVDVGNDVLADNTILATLVQLDPLYAYFDVDERTLLRIGPLLVQGKVPPEAYQKFPVMLGLANEKPEEFSHKGELKFADNKVDPNTGTLRMWGTFENTKLDLRPGLFIRVRMGIGDPKSSLFVSEAALGSDQGRRYLYLVSPENKIVYTPVEVGQRKNGLIAVQPAQGYQLSPSDRIVVSGLQRVRPKMEVESKLIPMPRVKSEVTSMPLITKR
jgi:multidrug efflux system membrane fusion protein